MSDRTDSKLRELTYRLIAMAPEAPPFPEEPMAQLEPYPTPATPRRNLVRVAVAGAAAIALIGTPLVLSNLDGATEPAPPATEATVPTTAATTIPDPTTPTTVDPAPGTTTVPETTALPALTPGTIVIADPGAATGSAGGVAVIDADTAIGDGAWGLVIQRDQTILHVAPDGTEFALLAASDLTAERGPVTLRLQDVTEYFGVPNAVIVVGYGQEYPDVFEEIWLLDLNSGAIESVYQIVAVEASITRVSAAAGTMIASVSFEGGTYLEYLTTAGRVIDPPGPYADTIIGAPEYPELVAEGVLSPGGLVFAYVEVPDIQTYQDGFLAANVVIWDLDTGAEIDRIPIELTDGAWPGRMDYDGTTVVLGRRNLTTGEVLTPLRIESLETGIITEIDTAGVPSLVKALGAPAAPAGIQLGSDGLGIVALGAEPEAAIAAVSSLLGAPAFDTGWVDAATTTCPGTEYREVSWNGLILRFGDAADATAPDGGRHLFAYFHTAGSDQDEAFQPTTAEGIGLGSTVAELEAAYGEALATTESPAVGPTWQIDAGVFFGGGLSGLAAGDVVTSIEAGIRCAE